MKNNVKRRFGFFSVLLVLCALLSGCENQDYVITDGTYRAEFDTYDANGYKDYVEITFSDGLVTEIEADAISEADGSLKSACESVRNDMEPLCGTYPEKYYKDLINQYLADPQSSSVDIVAGATWTSNDFILLVQALEEAVCNGNTETVIVSRPQRSG